MPAIRTARERARAELTAEIKSAARRQLGEAGAAQLSLRAVARELGMVSSALYRYFPSRDDLLTALIVDAYGALADAMAEADDAVPAEHHRERWRVIWRAVRSWARQHPSEYALIFGSPVPGYHAPQDTVEPFTRVARCFIGVVADADAAGVLDLADVPGDLPAPLDGQLTRAADDLEVEIPAPALAATFLAFSQLIGSVSLERFGHFTGSVDPADAYFDYAVERAATLVGLPEPD